MSEKSKPTLLVIDDSGFMRLRMKKIFYSLFQIEEASDGEEGLAKITGRGFKIDLVLLDINMPGISGIDVLKALNKDGGFQSLPIIIFSGEEDLQLEALNNGAWDFVSKDEAPQILRARVKNVFDRSLMNKVKRENALINNVLLNIINYSQDLIFEWSTLNDSMFFIGNIADKLKVDSSLSSFNELLDEGQFIYPPDIGLFRSSIDKIKIENRYTNEELRIVLDSGEVRWCKFTFYGEFNKHDNLEKIVGIASDVHAFKEAIDAATSKAEHDALTGLVNRVAYENFYEVVSNLRVNSAMLLVDVDSFKSVNDSIGHIGGDFVLKLVAERLKHCFRDTDCVARVGGDEFAVIMSDVKSKYNLIDKADKLLEIMREPFEYEGKVLHQYISAGILYIPKTEKLDYLEAYKLADKALYESKENNRNRYTVVERNN
jgi:diguanylate cyclase (GGDEF)-like protein